MLNSEGTFQRGSARQVLRGCRRAERRQLRRKVQALAAGGMMLGFGAMATLAAWTDQESSIGEFEAGQFGIEIDAGKGWNSEPQMEFGEAALSPGESVYAPVLVRSSPQTSVDGTVTVSGLNPQGGLAPYLQFRVESIDASSAATTCSAGVFRDSDTEFVNLGADVGPFQPQELQAQSAETVAYCFEVQLDPEAPNETQNLTADYTWRFHAQSVTP